MQNMSVADLDYRKAAISNLLPMVGPIDNRGKGSDCYILEVVSILMMMIKSWTHRLKQRMIYSELLFSALQNRTYNLIKLF
jgi:hypothetical protein